MSDTETRGEPMMTGSPLCDADGHAWVWTWPIEGGEGSVGQCSLCGRITTAERDAAARAEVARLREAVEAVRARLPHGLPDGIEDDYERGYAHASDDVARRIDAVLAPVVPSGETESGETAGTGVNDGRGPHLAPHGVDDAPDESKDHGVTPEAPPAPVPAPDAQALGTFLAGVVDGPVDDLARQIIEAGWTRPAPVSSGQRAEAFVELLPPDVGHNLRHFGPETVHVTGRECHCHPEPIQHTPAPVVPSGEAESGEGDVCASCGHAVLDLPEGGFRHVDSRLDLSHPIELAPAPVSSGGQADGEGESPATVALRLSEAATRLSTQGSVSFAEAMDVLMAAAGYVPAARPVLSHEALNDAKFRLGEARRICEHWRRTNADLNEVLEHLEAIGDVLAGEQR